ncbi:ribonuclease VapC [Candidatus Bathyarchaeota archaeon]|nr:ribonuclease VapC [Candidatus Bathyarchaeota archaeon]MBS7636154.1 ribonuclease VapC [Candidatus Bathyarchaeota archaeon]
MAGFDPFSISEEQYTVPMVREEISGSRIAQIRFKTAIESGRLKVQTPGKVFIDEVKASAKTVGDAFWLSETDMQVLALALKLKMQGYTPLVATDDYSIQNVARHLGLEFASLATFGIRQPLKWIRYCPACRRKYPSDYKLSECQICGTELKRKPYKKSKNL